MHQNRLDMVGHTIIPAAWEVKVHSRITSSRPGWAELVKPYFKKKRTENVAQWVQSSIQKKKKKKKKIGL
jgi:hypothetical protein